MPYKNTDEHRAYTREYNRKYYQTHPEFAARQREKQRVYQKEYYKTHPEMYRRNQERSKRLSQMYSEIRKWVLEQLGGKCSFCGYQELVALDIHHIKGRDNNERWHNDYYTFIKMFKRGFLTEEERGNMQCLCANCHRVLHSKTNMLGDT